jgi:hypothetical protein
VALSRLPWLTSLHALRTCGTWTRGYFFSDEKDPDEPEWATLPITYGLRPIPAVQFANERRRGWAEASDSPPRVAGDAWDQHRSARLQKPQPGGARLLGVESLGWAGGEFGVEQAVDGLRVSYWLEANDDIQPLADVQWADWDAEGRLLVATRSGKLQIWDLEAHGAEPLFEEDLSLLEPDPQPAPAWARRW